MRDTFRSKKNFFSKIKFLIKLLTRFFDTIQFQKWTNWRLGRSLASAKKRVISNLNVNDIFDAIPSFDESGFVVYQSNISLEKK